MEHPKTYLKPESKYPTKQREISYFASKNKTLFKNITKKQKILYKITQFSSNLSLFLQTKTNLNSYLTK